MRRWGTARERGFQPAQSPLVDLLVLEAEGLVGAASGTGVRPGVSSSRQVRIAACGGIEGDVVVPAAGTVLACDQGEGGIERRSSAARSRSPGRTSRKASPMWRSRRLDQLRLSSTFPRSRSFRSRCTPRDSRRSWRPRSGRTAQPAAAPSRPRRPQAAGRTTTRGPGPRQQNTENHQRESGMTHGRSLF